MDSQTYVFHSCIGDIDIPRNSAPEVVELVTERSRVVLGRTNFFSIIPISDDTGDSCDCGSQSAYIITDASDQPIYACNDCLEEAAQEIEEQFGSDVGELLADELDSNDGESLERINDRTFVYTDEISRPHQTPSGDYLLPHEMNGFELQLAEIGLEGDDISFELRRGSLYILFNKGYIHDDIPIKSGIDSVDVGTTYDTYSSMTRAFEGAEEATERINVDISFE